MISEILSYILDHWEEIFPGRERPARLSFLQISLGHGKKFERGRIIYPLFAAGEDEPLAYAKICRDPAYDPLLQAEYDILARLQASGSLALRATNPRPLALLEIEDRYALLESALPGSPMTHRVESLAEKELQGVQVRVESHFSLIEDWLVELYRTTATGSVPIDAEFVARWVEPVVGSFLSYLRPSRAERVRYLGLLEGFKALEGQELPMALTNGNLSPWTVVVDDGGGQIGVVDWKFAGITPLPLRDYPCFAFCYFQWCHRKGYLGDSGRSGSYEKTFLRRGNWLAETIFSHMASLHRRLAIDGRIAELLFPLSLMHELNIRHEFFYRFGNKPPVEKRLVDAWLGRKGIVGRLFWLLRGKRGGIA